MEMELTKAFESSQVTFIYIAFYTIPIVSKQRYSVNRNIVCLKSTKVNSLIIKSCYHPVQLSSNSVCAISQASPTISKPKMTAARNQNSIVDRMEEKNLGRSQVQSGGSVVLWPDETSMAWFNSRLRNKSG